MKKLLYSLAIAAMMIAGVPAAMHVAQPVVAAEQTVVPVPATASLSAQEKSTRFPERADQPAEVKILVRGGHGSGVHIGNGYFLTACHVAKNANADTKIKLHDGSVRPAETLWCNEGYDIALMRAKPDGIEAAELSCTEPAVGDELSLAGNPLMLENITAFARVAGDERSLAHWKSVFIVDGATMPGQSGGPAYNAKHEVVGITVGVVMWPISPMSQTATGYGAIVPGKTVCELLARV